MKRALTVLAAALLLGGCGSSVSPKDPNVNVAPSPVTSKKVKVIPITGDQPVPRDVSVLCVDGFAFLSVFYEVMYAGNPPLARFPEMDETCR